MLFAGEKSLSHPQGRSAAEEPRSGLTGVFRQLPPAMYDERVTTRLTRLILLFAMLFTASMPAMAAFDVAEVALGVSADGAQSASDAEEHTYFVGESGVWVHNTYGFEGITCFSLGGSGARVGSAARLESNAGRYLHRVEQGNSGHFWERPKLVVP